MFRRSHQMLILSGISALLVSCSTTNEIQAQSKPSYSVPQVHSQVISAEKHKNIEIDKELTLKQIMADPDWIGRQPETPYWSFDSKSIFYKQKQQGNSLKDLWHKSLSKQGNGQKVKLADTHLHAYQNKVLSADRTQSAWVFEGSIFVRKNNKKIKQLMRDNNHPYNLRFLNDGRLSYQAGDAFYAIHPETGFFEQLVSWRFADKPQANESTDDYIAEQQLALIETAGKKRRNKQLNFVRAKNLKKENSFIVSDDFYFSKNNINVEASLSPNGKWLILVEEKSPPKSSHNDIMPNYINDNGRIEVEPVRERVTDSLEHNHNVWLLNLHEHKKTKLSYSSLPGYNEDVLAAVRRENAKRVNKDYKTNRLPRNITLLEDWNWSQSAIQWHQSGDNVSIMLEAWDNKDRWLATIDMEDPKLITQHRLHDDAWINYTFNSFGWLNNSKALYYLSEETGYSHLYIKPLNESPQALTRGKYEVNELTLSQDDKSIYFKGNKKHPGIYEVYKVDLADRQITQLTNLNGMTDYQLSPDENQLLLTHSSLIRPPELFIQAVTDDNTKQLTHTTNQEFLALNWIAPDIVPIKSSNVTDPIYSRIYSPSESQGKANKAVVFNHGAGYLQNSHLGWSGYFREFMFHNLLVQKGYAVLDMDYRASAGYGRDWRTAIYRQMGTPELEDLQDGVDWLVNNLGVDRAKVGTYGGSYGGFLTFMSLFKQPDLFKAGAALRPVTDWAHYNHGYTSNILNTPDIDPIAYERSSPIYFAEGLKNPLLINAPMVDSNVFFVDVVRLVQRLIELEKQNFETAIYPVESHGFVQPSSWLDEYRRILKLFESNL